MPGNARAVPLRREWEERIEQPITRNVWHARLVPNRVSRTEGRNVCRLITQDQAAHRGPSEVFGRGLVGERKLLLLEDGLAHRFGVREIVEREYAHASSVNFDIAEVEGHA